MKKTLIILICTICVNGQAKEITKAWDQCHHAVYGRAEKTMAFNQGEEPLTLGVVPLTKTGILQKIRFDSQNHAFIIKHTGTYVIEYFLEPFYRGTDSAYQQYEMAIEINGNIRRYHLMEVRLLYLTNLTPVLNGTYIANLRKKDRVRLVITKIPTLVGTTIGFKNFATSGDIPPTTVAYLDIRKAERK